MSLSIPKRQQVPFFRPCNHLCQDLPAHGNAARLQVDYVYTPFGQVREDGIIPQPIRWSGEMCDAETGPVYYDYRCYSPRDGRWTRRDPIGEGVINGPAGEIAAGSAFVAGAAKVAQAL